MCKVECQALLGIRLFPDKGKQTIKRRRKRVQARRVMEAWKQLPKIKQEGENKEIGAMKAMMIVPASWQLALTFAGRRKIISWYTLHRVCEYDPGRWILKSGSTSHVSSVCFPPAVQALLLGWLYKTRWAGTSIWCCSFFFSRYWCTCHVWLWRFSELRLCRYVTVEVVDGILCYLKKASRHNNFCHAAFELCRHLMFTYALNKSGTASLFDRGRSENRMVQML